jgi:hypothetical protein
VNVRMVILRAACPAALVVLFSSWLLGCGSEERAREPFAASSDAAPEADCDPREVPEAGTRNDGPGSTGSGSRTEEIDLTDGGPGPSGRLSCSFGCMGALTCCELKQVCYDPGTEPEFCLRPYCE